MKAGGDLCRSLAGTQGGLLRLLPCFSYFDGTDDCQRTDALCRVGAEG